MAHLRRGRNLPLGNRRREADIDRSHSVTLAQTLSSARLRSAHHRKGDPRERPQRTRLKLYATALREGNLWRSASGYLSCAIDGDLGELRPGDRVRVAGFISRLPRALNPGEFDFSLHARADRELCQIRSDIPDAVQILRKAEWYWPASWLPKVRLWGTELLKKYLSQYEATLAGAILLGTREELPYEQTEEFLLTGTIHVLSISGMHVGILAWGLFLALRSGWIGRRKALWLIMLLTWTYTIMTDSEPPAVRASILVCVVCGSLLIGKAGLAFNSLAFAALIVFMFNPNDLFRTGTQLSFISMGVLSWLSSFWSGSRLISPLDRLIQRTMSWHERLLWWFAAWFVISLVTGTLIWSITLPLVVARFYLISWSALVLNIFLSPITTLAMICGFLCSPPVGGSLERRTSLAPVATRCWNSPRRLSTTSHARRGAIPGIAGRAIGG